MNSWLKGLQKLGRIVVERPARGVTWRRFVVVNAADERRLHSLRLPEMPWSIVGSDGVC